MSDFYGRKLYSCSIIDWEELAKEFIPHFVRFCKDEERKIGWCSYCGSPFWIDDDEELDIYSTMHEFKNAKHNDRGNCPVCDYSVRYINENKMTSYGSLVRVHRLIFFDIIDFDHVNAYAVRAINYPDRDYEEQFIDFEPVSCYELSPGSAKMYVFNGEEWKQRKNYGEPYQTYYGHGGDYILVSFDAYDCFLKYSRLVSIEHLGRSRQYFYGDSYVYEMTYLCDYCMYPQLEFLMKARGYIWVHDLVYNRNFNRRYINWKAKSYTDMFRLTKLELKAFMKCNLSKSVMELYYDSEKKIPFVDFCTMFHKYSSEFHRQLIDLLLMYDIKIDKLNSYFNSHMIPRDRFNSCVYDSTFQFWRDYIEACEKLGIDLNQNKSLLFPKDLIEAHDIRVAEVDLVENEALIARARRSLERRDKQYRFENEQFIIYLPHIPRELVEESNMQDNCVAKNYIDKHFRDECTICFLREKSRINESFYTIEMRGKTLQQKHGIFNDQMHRANTPRKKALWADYMERPREAADEFFETWLLWVKNGSKRAANGKPIIDEKKVRSQA